MQQIGVAPKAYLENIHTLENWKPCLKASCPACDTGHLHDCPSKWLDWRMTYPNIVTLEGRNSVLAVYLDADTQITTWYAGLVDNAGWSAYAAADVMSSHAGWAEYIAYSEAVRQTLTFGTASAGSLDNSAAVAVYSIDGAGGTVRGAFVVSESTKSGTTGVLYGVGDSAASKTVTSGDTVNLTVTATAASA